MRYQHEKRNDEFREEEDGRCTFYNNTMRAAHSFTSCVCNQTYGNRTQLKQQSCDWFR